MGGYKRRQCSKCEEDLMFQEADPCDKCTEDEPLPTQQEGE
jgi:hypothetical protein